MTRFMDGQYCINRFRGARADPSLVVLEGLHPLKHALRFGAEIVEAVSVDRERLLELAGRLAPDIIDRLRQCIVPVDLEVFEELAPVPPATGVIALAKRPAIVVDDVLGGASLAPVVLLERPRNPFNIGASVRVAAGAGAAGFLTTGVQDPWHPSAVLSGVGLHFALPVARIDTIEAIAGTRLRPGPGWQRPLVVVDPVGDPLAPGKLPDGAVLAFGNERDGISPQLARMADSRVSIPNDGRRFQPESRNRRCRGYVYLAVGADRKRIAGLAHPSGPAIYWT